MVKQTRYLSYLLRLWQTSDGEKQIWRASLESPGTGERRGFASLKELVAFLESQIEQPGLGLERAGGANVKGES